MVNEVNASHILVKTEEEANRILNDIKNGKSFADLAREKSACPSGQDGGKLGWFDKGRMVPEFEKACFEAKPNEVVGPVKTKFGWHIIKINDVR